MKRHEGVYRYSCGFCHKGLSGHQALKEHLTSHTQQNYFHCSHCSVSFRYHSQLRAHEARIHRTGGLRGSGARGRVRGRGKRGRGRPRLSRVTEGREQESGEQASSSAAPALAPALAPASAPALAPSDFTPADGLIQEVEGGFIKCIPPSNPHGLSPGQAETIRALIRQENSGQSVHEQNVDESAGQHVEQDIGEEGNIEESEQDISASDITAGVGESGDVSATIDAIASSLASPSEASNGDVGIPLPATGEVAKLSVAPATSVTDNVTL